MTLLEVLVVLGIVGLLLGVLSLGLRRARKLDLRSNAAKLAAAFRSAFDRTASTGRPHRIVLDLEAQTFQLQRCEGKVIVRRTVDEAQAEEAQKVLEQEERIRAEDAAKEAAQAALGSGGALAEVAPPPDATKALGAATCEPVKGSLGKPQKIETGRGIRVKTIYIAHLSEAVTEGKVTVNFWPPGRGERTVVELAQKEDVFAVVVHPLTGRVTMKPGAWDHPEEFVTTDVEGHTAEEEP